MSNISADVKYKTAIRIAIVSGVFTLIVLALMFDNFTRRRSLTPGFEERLEILKTEFRQSPKDIQLQEVIRQLDRDIRHDRMRWISFSEKGSWLLLFGAAVFVASFKYALSQKKSTPEIDGNIPVNAKTRRMILSRRAVLAGVFILLAGAGWLALKNDIIYIAEDVESFYDNWPTFRGPYGDGVANNTGIPLTFDVKTGENILWKSPAPMVGMNSPVVWGNRIFMSGADDKKRQVYCFDADSGKLLWTRDVKSMVTGDYSEPMEDTGYSAPTMAVDGKRVYAIFATGDIAAFDFDGREIWSKNLGGPDSTYGYASSLAMHEKLLIIQYDQGASNDALSKLIALDGFSGQAVWQTKRPVANSWASPVIVKIGEAFQLITCADPFVISYDPKSGNELWRAECVSGDVAPSSIYAGGLVLAIDPYNAMTAIRPDGTGNVTETHIAWQGEDNIPDICSPAATDKVVYLLSTEGTLTCHGLSDGKVIWEKDLDGMFQSSPSIIGDKLLIVSEDGEFIVIDTTAAEYKEISRSKIGEHCFASPAFAEGRMYIRTKENLYCIGAAK